MTLVSQRGGSDGAAYLIFSSPLDRMHRAWMGPNDKKQPAVGYDMCNPNACQGAKYADGKYNYRLVEEGREYTLEAFMNSKRRLQFNLDWQLITEAALGRGARRGAIREFEFYLFSNPKRNFHVTLDDVWITYA